MANIIEHLKKEEFSKVLGFCREELKKNPNDANLLVIKGWCLFKENNFDEACQYIEAGIKHTELHIVSIRLALDYFSQINRHEKLIKAGELHLKKYQNDANLWGRLGISRSALGDESQAIRDFRQALLLHDNHQTRFYLSLLLLNGHDFSEGVSLYESRLEAFPNANWFSHKTSHIPL